MPQFTDNTLANTPTSPAEDDDPRHMKEDLENINTHIDEIKKEFSVFRAEFSNFWMDLTSINFQADLENVQNAQIAMNGTLMSRMDTFDRELNSQMNNLKEFIHNTTV